MSHDLGKAPRASRLVLLDIRIFLGLIAADTSHTRMSRIPIESWNFARFRLTGLIYSSLLIAIKDKGGRSGTHRDALLIPFTENHGLCFRQSCMDSTVITACPFYRPVQQNWTSASLDLTAVSPTVNSIVIDSVATGVAVTLVSF